MRGKSMFLSLAVAICVALALALAPAVALAAEDTDDLEAGEIELVEQSTQAKVGQQVVLSGVLERYEKHWDISGDGVGTNCVFYVLELSDSVTGVSSDGSSNALQSVQVASVLTGTRTSSSIVPLDQMKNPAFEPYVGNYVTVSGKLATSGGTFIWTVWQLQSAAVTADNGSAQLMYRLYNPNSGEHFYTASAKEKDGLVKAGWKYEGVGWVAPTSKTSKKPVHRLYSGTDHHYTMSATERDKLVDAGWTYEGIGWFSADEANGVPLYRQFNPNVKPWAARNNSGSHNYTTSKAENDKLVKLGWRAEGIGWYGLK